MAPRPSWSRLQPGVLNSGRRSAERWTPGIPSCSGSLKGAIDVGLRSRSAEAIAGLDFDGVALGGLVLGEPPQVRQVAVDACVQNLPDHLPRYLMGLGTDLDLLDSISRGVDLFDCVLPTRLARTGTALTTAGRISLRQSRFRNDSRQLETDCECPACSNFSRAYLRHLYLAGEILAHRMLSLHNLRHMGGLMAGARRAIESGRLQPFIEIRRRQLAEGTRRLNLEPAAGGPASPPPNI